MIQILKWLLLGHVHKWKTVEKAKVWSEQYKDRPVGYRFIQECEHCGIVKAREMI